MATKIYVDITGSLRIDNKTYSTNIPLVFEDLGSGLFEIDYANHLNIPLIGRTRAIDCVNESDVPYADVAALWGEVGSFFANASGDGGYPQVETFADLPAPADHIGETFIVLNSTGVYLINRHEAGLYYSNGVAYNRLGDIPSFFNSTNFEIYDGVDDTKAIKFNASGIASGVDRTIHMPNEDVNLGTLNAHINTVSEPKHTIPQIEGLTNKIIELEQSNPVRYVRFLRSSQITLFGETYYETKAEEGSGNPFIITQAITATTSETANLIAQFVGIPTPSGPQFTIGQINVDIQANKNTTNRIVHFFVEFGNLSALGVLTTLGRSNILTLEQLQLSRSLFIKLTENYTTTEGDRAVLMIKSYQEGSGTAANASIAINGTTGSRWSFDTVACDVVPFKVYGETNDGSTNILEGYNQNLERVFNIDTRGFERIEWRDEYAAGDMEWGANLGLPPLTNVVLEGEPDGDGNATIVLRVRNFDTVNRVGYGSFEIAHDIDVDAMNALTTSAEMHVHWLPLDATAGTVVWQLDYMVLGATGINSTPYTITSSIDVAINSDGKQKISAFNNAVLDKPTNGWMIGDIISFAIRIGAATTYTGGRGLIKVAMHVPVNSRGSRQRIIK
jgi:hypothetical protein